MNLRIIEEVVRPPRALVERFRRVPSTVASDAMGKANAMSPGIQSAFPDRPLVGTAVTVRTGVGDATAVHVAINHAKEGDVLVIDAGGRTETASWGFLTTTAALQRGVVGAVVDGAARDRRDIRESGLALFSRGFTPAGPQSRVGGVINEIIQGGGVLVRPGDLVLGDEDGVVVVPAAEAEAVLGRAEEKLAREEEWIARLRAGASNLDVLGLRELLQG
jgi:4-hydroxy-4-methyl-2-oxoglutarate aldolase